MALIRTLSIVLAVALQGIPGSVMHVCRMDQGIVRAGCPCGHSRATAASSAKAGTTVRAERCCELQPPSVTATVACVGAHTEWMAVAPHTPQAVVALVTDDAQVMRPVELRPELLPQGPPIYVAVRSLLI